MLFFQVVLVLGYAYAHWLNKLAPRKQAVAHISLPPYARCSAIPFLGILPLAVYLLSFIICFESPRLLRAIFIPLLMLALAFMAYRLWPEPGKMGMRIWPLPGGCSAWVGRASACQASAARPDAPRGSDYGVLDCGAAK